MIKSYLGLVIIFAIQHHASSLSSDTEYRVAHRKNRIRILQEKKRSEITQDPIDNYDLIVTEPSKTRLIKPVLRHRHLHHRHRSGKGANITVKNYNPHIPLKDADTLRKNFNLTGETNKKQILEDNDATTTDYLNQRGEDVAITHIQENKDATSQNPVKKYQNVTPVVSFYRRVNYLNDQERNKPQKWVHCLDMIAPRLKGYKDNWHPKEVTNSHGDVKRLSDLLKTDVSKYTEEEIVSVLYQISSLNLRLFQWDYSAVTSVLNVIITGTKHDFKTLKHGIKHLFERWHLDTSMMETFLEQTRIIRPPCIDISGLAGFTKKAGGVVLFTKPHAPTKKPRGGNESCHSWEVNPINNN